MGTVATHIHPNAKEFIERTAKLMAKLAGGLEAEARFMQPGTPEDIIADMDANEIEESVLLAADFRTRGEGYIPNDHIAELANKYPERFRA